MAGTAGAAPQKGGLGGVYRTEKGGRPSLRGRQCSPFPPAPKGGTGWAGARAAACRRTPVRRQSPVTGPQKGPLHRFLRLPSPAERAAFPFSSPSGGRRGGGRGTDGRLPPGTSAPSNPCGQATRRPTAPVPPPPLFHGAGGFPLLLPQRRTEGRRQRYRRPLAAGHQCAVKPLWPGHKKAHCTGSSAAPLPRGGRLSPSPPPAAGGGEADRGTDGCLSPGTGAPSKPRDRVTKRPSSPASPPPSGRSSGQ